ncbi:endo-1,4-beta-xylanase [Marinoscillum sp. MHG1-6]|uniref:endo-1,4-beta-xylanase n=1 Tax=Marinoscillum sp. MHG1-6 TaxID=2959627 RepID=UPI0021577561|nr:endo-1,4-beta-xylanase [Marinoscillum sp. MHG1-6]
MTLITVLFLETSFNLLTAQSIDIEVPTGRRLKKIAEEKFIFDRVFIGASVGYKAWGDTSFAILKREFNFVTPTNEFKQTYIHPDPGTWRWERCDQWVDTAALNGHTMRMHSPISPQASTWAKTDTRTAGELETNMTEYMTELCKRYNGVEQIKWMDVVNETVERDGSWFGPKDGTDKWENPWPLIGYDITEDGLNPPSYIRMAFEIANQYAPDIKLVYNQHGGMEVVMWEKVKKTILYLKSLGLRVDALGWQAHIASDFLDDETNIIKLKGIIEWAHNNDLEFHVTENDVDELGDEQAQADVFAAIVKTVVEQGLNGVVGWNAWNIRDSDGQKAASKPNFFRQDGSPKPGYYAIQEVLENVVHSAELTSRVFGQGEITLAPGHYLLNSSLNLAAIPAKGYAFWKWDGDLSGSDSLKTLVMDADKYVAAYFLQEDDPRLVLGSANSDLDIMIYPNPVNHRKINISLPGTKPQQVQYQLYDAAGKVISQNQYDQTKMIEIERDADWNSGIYILHIIVDDQVIQKKLVLN